MGRQRSHFHQHPRLYFWQVSGTRAPMESKMHTLGEIESRRQDHEESVREAEKERPVLPSLAAREEERPGRTR
jgi:hypothetical protein